MKLNLIVGSLGIALLFLIAGCSSINPSERVACENSGGQYLQGASEAGPINYCKCPINKYETKQKICEDITQEDINNCQSLSNDYVTCKNSVEYNDYYHQGICQCNFKASSSISYFTYAELLNNECPCHCNKDACTCGPCQAT